MKSRKKVSAEFITSDNIYYVNLANYCLVYIISAKPEYPQNPNLRKTRISAKPESPQNPNIRQTRISAKPEYPPNPNLRETRISAKPNALLICIISNRSEQLAGPSGFASCRLTSNHSARWICGAAAMLCRHDSTISAMRKRMRSNYLGDDKMDTIELSGDDKINAAELFQF